MCVPYAAYGRMVIVFDALWYLWSLTVCILHVAHVEDEVVGAEATEAWPVGLGNALINIGTNR